MKLEDSSPSQAVTTQFEELAKLHKAAQAKADDAPVQQPESKFTRLLRRLSQQDRIDRFEIDAGIVLIDQLLSAQVNEILHAPEFQALERAWRSLQALVERLDFQENIELNILNASKQDLADDFEDSYPVTTSSLYNIVYTNEYGSHGGRPFAMICANYEFGPDFEDIVLLRDCTAVAAMAHAPFIANAAPSFFGQDSYRGLPELADLESLLESPQYKQWHKFRQNPDARNLGLCLPRFLLRLPYGEHGTPVQGFHFQERCAGHHERFLWGPASVLFASRVADSFAKYRWCPNITGPQSGGTVRGLLHHHYETMGSLQSMIPTEVQITDAREYALSTAGFISLTYRKRDKTACFYSASSVYAPSSEESPSAKKERSIDRHIATQLPYLFIVTRLAHYMKVMQREHIGEWLEPGRIESHLNDWIRQYVADMETPGPMVRARRPLRKARVRVSELEDEPGWIRSHIEVQPHFKYLGADFVVSLDGKLEHT